MNGTPPTDPQSRIRFLTAAVLLSLAAALPAADPPPVFPARDWTRLSPDQAGLDPEALQRFAATVGGRGCVVRHGYLVHEWGDAARRGDVASAAKPVYAHFLLKAVEDRRLASLDEPVARHEPRLNNLNAPRGHKDRLITWRHLANQTACYGVAENPGEAFCYNDWQMALFWDTLFLKLYGTSHAKVDEDVLRPLLTDRLACQDDPSFLAFGGGSRPGRLAISPRDFARFGLLYLRRGDWNGTRLIDADLARTAVTSPLPNTLPRAGTEPAEMIPGQRSIGSQRVPDNQTDHLGSYSFLWWTNGIDRDGKRHWPDAPPDTYAALGHGGKRALVVIPSLDLVASWNDSTIDGRDAENTALAALTRAASPPPR